MRTPSRHTVTILGAAVLALLAALWAPTAQAKRPEAVRKVSAAQEAYDKGQVDEAIRLYTEAIQIDPQYAGAYYARSQLYREQHEWDKELADLNSTLAIDKKHLGALRRRADSYFYGKKYLDAELDYSAAIKIEHDYWRDYYMRGRARAIQGHLEAAVKDFDDAIEKNYKAYDAYYERGKAYVRLGKTSRAERDFEKALELNDEHAWANHELGKLRFAAKEYDEALKRLTSAERLSEGKYGAPLYWRGRTYSALQDWQRAVADYTTATTRKYDTVDLRYYRAAAYYELGEFEKARDDLKAALQKEPENARCTWALGQVEAAIARQQHVAEEEGQANGESGSGDEKDDEEFVNPL